MSEPSKRLLSLVAENPSICVLTGAGISAESGIKTFRDPDGLWAKFKPEELASMDGFMANPEIVWEWYQMRKDTVHKASPNAGHDALVTLEKGNKEKGKAFTLVTQNVDRLHMRAGSENVLELLGI